ncbi:2-dehydro-3-deoxy-D-gluconate 5-dehydrogenase KduD [Gilvimarinus sp. 2_MG-2023]|uniref:2-dehydro-3-deoxy-D-gluconate 5-dehydrogenase KduD n=1 Tax=Gilvimarinus sp. 2_MG-2023 TaxID=3062666 RepID=UPI0026E287A7|nr:2-dehydro-3-deoxy-D-gluconate 5-dehydrogenase KduD [Gilvimarinus sp. 2_MG-2023]MDO6571383.1 2-dehydro-3-deoxy-D-gluconate 5-dehydrogenase KduD [Gilvimarinus sp. 2_MG-2023]
MSDSIISQLFSVEGKVALVTGASRGLGQAMALALAQAGAKVVALGSRPESLNKTCDLFAQHKLEIRALGCDQRSADSIRSTVAQVLEEFGRIDILINNAGTIHRAPAHEFSDEDWDDVIETNLNGVFRMCREVGRSMLSQGSGKIINIASLLSFSGGITVPAYAASKGGVAQLTKALANEWAKDNIQVNAIAPGYFETDNTENLRKDSERSASISARIPTARWGVPDDLAGTAIYLSSKASDYVNGHVLLVDGGWMAR